MKRDDDFEKRRKDLAKLTEDQLKDKFWELAEKIVNPMIDLAKTHTTPAVERSVLLRMGFSSLEAKDIVSNTMDRGLMGKGAGNVIYRVAKELGRDYREVGKELAQGKHWDKAVQIFKGAK